MERYRGSGNERRCVAVGGGDLGVTTRKSQTPGKEEVRKTSVFILSKKNIGRIVLRSEEGGRMTILHLDSSGQGFIPLNKPATSSR